MICVPIGEVSKTKAAHTIAESHRSDIDLAMLKNGTKVATGMIRFWSVKARQASQMQQIHREIQGKTAYCVPIGANTRTVYEDTQRGIDRAGPDTLHKKLTRRYRKISPAYQSQAWSAAAAVSNTTSSTTAITRSSYTCRATCCVQYLVVKPRACRDTRRSSRRYIVRRKKTPM